MPERNSGLRTVLIAGGGQAGGQAARQLLANGFCGRIVIAGGEIHLPYERPPLSKAVLKDAAVEGEIALADEAEWSDPRIVFRGADPVVALDPEGGIARLASGEEIEFDACLIATGGTARTLNVPGSELCLTLRTLDHSRALRKSLTTARSLVVIGGGVIGMEVASTASSLGIETTVIEAGPRIMARILPPELSAWLETCHREAGVRLLTGARLDAILQGPDGLIVSGSDATGQALKIDADIVLAAVGMQPNAGLLDARHAGPTGGIRTDAFGRIEGFPSIFALGDVAESWNPVYGRHVRLETWRNADRQARAVARTLSGTETAHVEIPWMWTDQQGRNIQVVGLWSEGAQVVSRSTPGDPSSVTLWLEDGRVAGGVLVDAGRERRFLEKLVETRAVVAATDLADSARPLKSLIS